MDIREAVRRNKRLITALTAIVAVYLIFRYLLPLFLPFLIAYLLALVIKGPVCFLNKKIGLKPVISGTILTILLFAGIGVLLYVLGAMLVEQLIAFVTELPVYLEMMKGQLEVFCSSCDGWFGCEQGTIMGIAMRAIEDSVSAISGSLLSGMPVKTVGIVTGIGMFAGLVLVVAVSVVLIAGEYTEKKETTRLLPIVEKVLHGLSKTGLQYLRVQGILICIVAAICSVGLFLTGNPYSLLIGIGIAVLDAFPVLGSGLVLVPWAVIAFIKGDYNDGAVITCIYILCQAVRQLLEPRLLGDKIGVKPIYTLISMYAGIKLFGVMGFVLGPFGVVIVKGIINAICTDGNKPH